MSYFLPPAPYVYFLPVHTVHDVWISFFSDCSHLIYLIASQHEVSNPLGMWKM